MSRTPEAEAVKQPPVSVASEPGTAPRTGDAAVSERAGSTTDPEGTEASCLREAASQDLVVPGQGWGRVPTAESGTQEVKQMWTRGLQPQRKSEFPL